MSLGQLVRAWALNSQTWRLTQKPERQKETSPQRQPAQQEKEMEEEEEEEMEEALSGETWKTDGIEESKLNTK